METHYIRRYLDALISYLEIKLEDASDSDTHQEVTHHLACVKSIRTNLFGERSTLTTGNDELGGTGHVAGRAR